MSQKSAKITDHTPLDELGIPFLDTVLEQAFILPPHRIFGHDKPSPQTVGELVARAPFTRDEVLRRLREIARFCQGIQLSPHAFLTALTDKEKRAIVIDFRSPEPSELIYPADYPWVIKVEILSQRQDAASAPEPNPEKSMFAAWQQITTWRNSNSFVVFLADTPEVAFSSAMSMREKNLMESYCCHRQ